MVSAPPELDLVHIPSGHFAMGSERFYAEESPVVHCSVPAFLCARGPVSNDEFAAFVDATGYVTTAEHPLDPGDLPSGSPFTVAPGSMVFTPTAGPVDLADWRAWWRWTPGASWRAPEGPGSNVDGLGAHPVVQVSFDDAEAYCRWAGVRLLTEPEWEFAARGGLEGATYAWGEEDPYSEPLRASIWSGPFPYAADASIGAGRTTAVGAFAPNGYGLLDMTGNVWEWTASPWSGRHRPASCECSPFTATACGASSSDMVAKGGSFLCSPEYCARYRPAARTRQSRTSSSSHLGFRVGANMLPG